MSDLYDAEYWQSMDGGAGVQDSLLWSDIAFIIHHAVGHDHKTGEDICGRMRFVDLGCGPGLLVKHLRSRGFDAYGLDISHTALEMAPEEVKPYLYWFDASFINDSHFGSSQFDLLVSTETLEHIDRKCADRVVKHIKNLLKPGGIAILTICVTGRPDADRDPTHVNVMPRSYWECMFEQHQLWPSDLIQQELMRFHLFETHGGVFALRKS